MVMLATTSNESQGHNQEDSYGLYDHVQFLEGLGKIARRTTRSPARLSHFEILLQDRDPKLVIYGVLADLFVYVLVLQFIDALLFVVLENAVQTRYFFAERKIR